MVCQSAGIIGSWFTFQSVSTWYAALIKPDFSPPNWLFGPVWIALYFLMGLSLYLVWENRAKPKDKKVFFVFFGIQLILNVLWSFFFFGLKSPLLGLADILFLDVTVALAIVYSSRVSVYHAILLVPYLAWILFATVLNYMIFLLN
jgi:tryptophan-rich sensory protein